MSKQKKYCVVYRQLSDNDDGLGWVDVDDANAYEDEPNVPYLVGRLFVNTDKYGNPKFVTLIDSGSHDKHACLYCDRGYFDLEPNDLDDIEKLAAENCIDAVWHGGGRPKPVKLPVEWVQHKVRRFTWSGELVQAGAEEV